MPAMTRPSTAPAARSETKNRPLKYKHHLLNDKWIIEDVYRGMRGGFFLEAGATNGVNGSATLVLERDYQWDGICVEPIPGQYRRILEWRRCSADNRALYSESGLCLEFTYLRERSGLSGLSTSLRQRTRQLAQAPNAATRISVQTVSLQDLFREHRAPRIIHYFCLDVEGAERAILRTFPFDGPNTILAFSIEGASCDEIMRHNSYRRVFNPHTSQTFEHYYLHNDIDRFLVADMEL